MHRHLQAFVQSAAEAFDLRGPVYKFGFFPLEAPVVSLRGCFPEVSYVGCNFTDPEELGRMDELARLPLPDATAGTVVALNLLERVAVPRQTVCEMTRILAPGGALVVGSSRIDDPCGENNRELLRPDRIARLLDGLEVTLVGWQGEPQAEQAVYAIGFKAPAPGPVFDGTARFFDMLQTRLDRLDTPGGIGARLLRALLNLAGLAPASSAARNPVRFVIDLPGICQGKPGTQPVAFSGGKPGMRLDLTE